MVSVEAILSVLDLEHAGGDRYSAGNVEAGHGVVFGGQLMAQSIVAGLKGNDGKTVKTLHTVFARAASPEEPVEISVERMHSGRSVASSTVTICQGNRLCTRSIVLLSAEEPDLIRHSDTHSGAQKPCESSEKEVTSGDWTVQVLDDVDINDPDAVGPPELDVWTRFPGAPDDVGISQALLAFATDGYLIGTAMRPHRGVGQAQAHVTLSTGVLSHTLTFHEHFRAGDWLLLSHRSPYAGHGRSYGHGDVYRTDGELVASFVQDNMIRAMPARPTGTGPVL